MTRRSRRELERALDDLAADAVDDTDAGGFDLAVEWGGGDDADLEADMVIHRRVVMRPGRAEREGVEILGPVDGRDDLVQIAWDGRDGS